MREIWKPLPYDGFSESYQVSNKGRIRSKDRNILVHHSVYGDYKRARKGKLLASRCTKKAPHLFVDVCRVNEEGISEQKTIYIHKAVALAFIKNPKKHPFVGHLKLDYENNEKTNLFWTNQSEVSKRSMLTHPENRNNLRDVNIKNGYYERQKKNK